MTLCLLSVNRIHSVDSNEFPLREAATTSLSNSLAFRIASVGVIRFPIFHPEKQLIPTKSNLQ